jgi:catechol 2,3-dioxygenase-like lactoylglutathione lyase family enzyme
MSVKVNALDHLVINVADVQRTAKWYATILGMEIKVFDPGHGKTPRTSLVFGNQKINVRPRDADKVEWFTADHVTAGSDDLCFLTSSTPDQVVAHQGERRCDRGRPGSQARRPRYAALGLLPRSGRESH